MKPYFERPGVRLYLGDAVEVSASLGAKADLLLADPPYGIGYRPRGNTSRKRSGFGKGAARDQEWEPIVGDDLDFDPSPWLGYPKIALFGGNYYADKLPPSRCWIAWDKKLGKSDDGADCELVWTNFDKPSRIFPHLWRGIVRAGEENVSRGPKLSRSPEARGASAADHHL